MDAAWAVDEEPVVGIVNSETATGIGTEVVADIDDESGTRSFRTDDALESVLAAHDGTAVRGDLEDVLAATPSLLVTAGANDLSAAARATLDVPVLPVGDVPGIETVDRDRLPAALEAVLEGDVTVERRPVLGVDLEVGDGGSGVDTTTGLLETSDDGPERALFDVSLVTDEPARISEYSVRSRNESVASFRADGVVVATPAGSHGYASAVDTPHLSSAVDAVAVAPIAPFATRTRRWVLPDDDVTLAVERDECDVTLVVDGRSAGTVALGCRITIGVDGTLSTLSVSDEDLLDR
ncbi:NAD(+)/NADH kinase [Natronorubrum sp. JWXQ-INN-674]|uniref:NAD(+)/NADH kinase n=1 Tax=Natronorubrum halalkaliphilum TaxID=2691917 RepID=A0A6B0VTF8_9EURY|nr:NAD(+)/NADH kinase [Natronorubrum halalkaliphilum]MXV64082.1 NAD(+)/NADH kinase [Natronorubrum halalkaliphilum]